jgi:Asp/Glu/hydantoin racemase
MRRSTASVWRAACEATPRPVFGIAECAILTALTLGARFGLISILPQVTARLVTRCLPG